MTTILFTVSGISRRFVMCCFIFIFCIFYDVIMHAGLSLLFAPER